MLAQACSAAGGPDVLTGEVLPQLLPLFSCAHSRRAAYGCTIPSAPALAAGAQQSAQQPLPAPNQAAPSVQALQRRMQDRLQLAMTAPLGSAGIAFSPCISPKPLAMQWALHCLPSCQLPHAALPPDRHHRGKKGSLQP